MAWSTAGPKEWVVVLHFQGVSRECFRLKESKGNFYAILALADAWTQFHASYHASGQRHFKAGPKGIKPSLYYPSTFQPTSALQGVELFFQAAPILRGQLQRFRIYKPSNDPAIILDADAAHFRDDVIFLRVFLLEPNSQAVIPRDLPLGPPLFHVIKETRPWVRIEFFQQSLAFSFQNGCVNYRQDAQGPNAARKESYPGS